MSKTNLCDQILSSDDIESKELFVPAWNCTVLVKGVTARVRREIVNASSDGEGSNDVDKFTKMFFIKSVCDPETGKPIFTDAKYEKLMEKSGLVVDDLTNAVADVNGLGVNAVEEQIKNSDSAIQSV